MSPETIVLLSWIIIIYAMGLVVFTIKGLTLKAGFQRALVIGIAWPYLVGKFISEN